jgi:hypothetical protein
MTSINKIGEKMSEDEIDKVAEAIFLAAWPKDRWERYKKGDVVHVLYTKMAVSAITVIKVINSNE